MERKDLELLLDACFMAKKLVETLPALPPGMKPRQIHVLNVVFELQQTGEGCCVSDVSRQLDTTMPSITKLIKELADQELLVKYAAQDKRVTLLRLTGAGEACVRKYALEFHQEWAGRLDGISSQQAQQVIEIITRLRDTMPGLEEQNHGKK